MPKPILNIIILGPQGSGKGTQASMLAERYHLAHIETGKILREMAKQKTALGRIIHQRVDIQGRLVSLDIIIRVLYGAVKKVGSMRGLIFDGFPRNVAQARALDRLFKKLGRSLTHVIYMPISRQTTVKRLAMRRQCRQCGTIFILGKNLKKNAQQCPRCHGQIFQREDDKPRAIAKRLSVYLQSTKPLINYYQQKGILITVDGEPPVLAVAKKLLQLFHGNH